MRVLVVNKFWYRRGGLERVMFDEITWLENAGHEVAHFSTRHPMNQPSPWEEYFVPYLELSAAGPLTARQKLTAAARMFWNREAKQRFERLLKVFTPEIVHMHGVHRQLSPSLVRSARRHGVPVVQTIHDYHPLCPCDTLLRGGAAICDPPRCCTNTVVECFRHRCTRGGAAASGLAAAEAAWRRRTMELASNMAVVISPSSFLANMLRTWLPKPPNLHVVPNAVRVRESGPATDYFLYAGRLSHEKGVTTLIEAAAEANLPVVIAGDGPIRAQLEERATGTVTFLGHVDGKTIDRYLEGAIASVVPSQWYENAPLAVLEPMACGRPVVASNVGGIPEMVRDHIDGLLVEPGDAHALAEALAHLASNPQLAAEMGARAREQVAQRFNPERHVDLLTRAYSEAIGRRPVL